jgi:hypothetical protein
LLTALLREGRGLQAETCHIIVLAMAPVVEEVCRYVQKQAVANAIGPVVIRRTDLALDELTDTVPNAAPC